MKTFLVLVLCLTSVFAAPSHNFRDAPTGSIWNWDFRSSMLDDFEANLKKMRDEFEQLEKSFGSGFHFANTDDSTGVQIFSNGTDIFNLDPTQVKNKTYSDTKIVDGKVVHTEEKVFANGNSVVHFKKVEITPKGASVSPSTDKPKKPFGIPSTPEIISTTGGSSKNDLDSEQVDNDEKPKSVEGNIFGDAETPVNPRRDVEEIERVSSPRSSTSSQPTSQHSQKQIYVL